jgi:hypothetical protein
LKRIFAISTSAALLLTGLTGAPAYAVAPGNCTTGSLTISSNVITSALGCSGEAVIPATVTAIGSSAFEDETDVHTITFEAGSSLTAIRAQAFTSSGVSSITIPSGVTSIGFAAFHSSALTAITIPASVTSIDISAFELTRDLAIVSFEAGSQLTQIKQATFRYSGLTSVEIPSGVTSIAIGAFYSTASLTTVRIPATVTAIGQSAFERTIKLTDVYFAGTTAPVVSADTFRDTASLRVSVPKANISYSARSSFGLLGTTWEGLSVQYDEPAPAPSAIAIPAPTTSPAIDSRAEMTFAFKGSALTKKQRTNLRAMVSEVGRKGAFEITVGVVKQEGMSRAAAKALARKQAKLFRGYLASRGIKPKQIVVKTKVLEAGARPFIGVAGS